MKFFRRNRSKVRTDEFTIPLRQLGWGRGYGKTYWYRDTMSPEMKAVFAQIKEKTDDE